MASKLYVEDLDNVYVGEINLSDGTTEYTRAYTTKGSARAQVTRNVGDRADLFMGKPIRRPYVTKTRVLVAVDWEEV